MAVRIASTRRSFGIALDLQLPGVYQIGAV
jgi:hypothetical protein